MHRPSKMSTVPDPHQPIIQLLLLLLCVCLVPYPSLYISSQVWSFGPFCLVLLFGFLVFESLLNPIIFGLDSLCISKLLGFILPDSSSSEIPGTATGWLPQGYCPQILALYCKHPFILLFNRFYS